MHDCHSCVLSTQHEPHVAGFRATPDRQWEMTEADAGGVCVAARDARVAQRTIQQVSQTIRALALEPTCRTEARPHHRLAQLGQTFRHRPPALRYAFPERAPASYTRCPLPRV